MKKAKLAGILITTILTTACGNTNPGATSTSQEIKPSVTPSVVDDTSAKAALEKAKVDGKEEVASYKDKSLYRDVEKSAIDAAILTANTAIDAATSLEGITSAINTYKTTVDVLKTDAQYLAEEAEAALQVKRASYLEQLKSNVESEDVYSREGKAALHQIYKGCEDSLKLVTTDEEMQEIVNAFVEEIKAVKTIVQENYEYAKAFVDSIQPAEGYSETITAISASKKTGLVKAPVGSDCLYFFGNQNLNENVAFNATFKFNLDEKGNVSIYFRAWDKNTALIVRFTLDKILLIETKWSDAVQKTVETVKQTYYKGVSNDVSYNIKVLAGGWTKAVLVNDIPIFHFDSSDNCVGYTGIKNTLSGYTLERPIYQEYKNRDELVNDYPELWYDCYTKEIDDAVQEVNTYIDSLTEDSVKRREMKKHERYLGFIDTLNSIGTAEEIPAIITQMKSMVDEVLPTIEGSEIEEKKAHSRMLIENGNATEGYFSVDDNGNIVAANGKKDEVIALPKITITGENVTNEHSFIEFEITPTLLESEDSDINITFRDQNNSGFRLRITLNKIYYVRYDVGDAEEWDSQVVDFEFANKTKHHIRIATAGWSKRVFIDNVCVVSVEDSGRLFGDTSIENLNCSYILENVNTPACYSRDDVLSYCDNFWSDGLINKNYTV